MGEFADRLWQLKRAAGDPSYEEMAGKLGAAASKSSLAAAAHGRVLPSWEIAWEFVRVLAVDRLGRDALETEKEWREYWTRARSGRAAEQTETGPVPSERAGGPATVGRGRRTVAVAAAAAVVAGGLVAVVTSGLGGQGDERAEAGPVAEHDDSVFEGDITYPDGTVVPPRSSFTKTWRLRNTGTVVWANRFLARVNEQLCTAPDLVPIPQTKPGETVDISVPVETPDGPASCKIYFKMADEQGRTFFPAKRPIFLDVRVGER
ncbi:NBR1-Ig-like domain-containing protein [Actinoplanes lobatus]|uniref:DNA-binding XRE family transcriptional regulator n=1 Tax=Actinoplanes lobatus TaxID=113568 RepID=A0A7W7HDX6_9ACTN|nr:NBR1-Ig-like domain-containing protein [Actinoplanes lobatus]MBB4748752.1 DNA-binding XRE family transcriptional regulator [Actinoplanes lobatus]